MRSIVAENIRRILDERGLSQPAAAELAGYGVSAFDDLLNGREPMTDCDIAVIADAFGVEPNDLFAA